MNWNAIWAIVGKDTMVVRRSKAVMLPIILVPLMLLVVAPVAVIIAAQNETAAQETLQEMNRFIEQMPAGMREAVDARETDAEKMIVLTIIYMMAPLYLVIPLLVATVMAADSFAGEKERKTIEALLYAPMTDRELLIAKVLSSWMPAVGVGLVGFIAYGVVVNAVEIYFPTWMWILLALWVTPAIAAMAQGVMVLVSSRVNTFQEAYQLGGLIVLPVVLLVVGQAAGVVYFSLWIVVLLGAVIWLINAVLFKLAADRFRRERLLLAGV
jgi:ABC-2 type transport system permease protein